MIEQLRIKGLRIPSKDIKASGFNISYSSSDDGPILIGTVAGGSLVVNVYNRGFYNNLKMRGEELYVKINGREIGPFIIEEAMYSYDKSVLFLECYDKIRDTNKSFSNSNVEFPEKAGFILKEVLKEVGIQIRDEDLDFLNSGIIINLKEEEKRNYSYRDIIEYIVQLSAGIGFIDPNTGTFKIKSILRRLVNPIKINADSIRSERISEGKKKTGVVYYKNPDEIFLYESIDDPIIIKQNPFINQLKDPEDFISYIGDLYKDKGEYNTGRVDIYETKDTGNIFTKNIKDGYFIGDTITDGDFRFIITNISFSPGGIIYLDSTGSGLIDVEMNKVKELKKNYKRE